MSGLDSVAIFWDYENCALPSNATGSIIVNNIAQLARRYGSVKSFRAYSELPEQPSPKNIALRSDLQLCGVSVIDCPHNGGKDVADKMMIVDMMAFAIDTPAPATIILITGDRDFVYAVSILSLRQYRLVVLAPTAAHGTLKGQAAEVYAWPADLLPENKATARRVSMSSATNAEAARSSSKASVFPPTQPVQPAASPASPPPSPERKGVLDAGASTTGSSQYAPPSWMSASSLFTPATEARPSLLSTPSSDSTAVDSGSEASSSHNLSSSPKPSGFTDSFKPKLSSWAELGASFAQRVATAATPPSPPTDWAKSLRNLSEIKLNANSLPFKTEYEPPFQTRSPAPNPPTAPSTPSWPKTIPPEFMPIVKVLKKQQKLGQDRLDFSMLGSLLRQECPNAYERAGVTKLKEYTNLAQEHGIVVSEDDIHGPGGIDGQRWVSLHPRLMGAKVYQASASG